MRLAAESSREIACSRPSRLRSPDANELRRGSPKREARRRQACRGGREGPHYVSELWHNQLAASAMRTHGETSKEENDRAE